MNSMGQLLCVGIVLTLVSGCGVINALKMRSANDDIEPRWTASASEVALKAHYEGEKPYIDIAINGIDGFRFLIDTGASISILTDSPRVRALGLQAGFELPMSGWGDEQGSRAYQTQVDSVDFGPFQMEKLNLAYIPVGSTPYFADPREVIFDGVLGYDVLRHFRWTFEKQQRRITVANTPVEVESGDVALPLDTFMTRISVDAEFNVGDGQWRKEPILIDTGSRHVLKLSALYLRNRDIDPGVTVQGGDFGLSGLAEHQRMRLEGLRLGTLEVNNLRTHLIETEDEDELWVIGSALLGHYTTIIDYFSEQMILRTSSQQTPFQSRFNLLGLELRKLSDGRFIVRYVMPNLPASAAGVQAGDIVTTLNGQSTPDISTDAWLSITNTPGNHALCLEKRGCLSLQATTIAGYSMPSG
ncbi:aspartyl protease family protein [Aestuariibacter halophilus]|uniref:Aspartyl protease family protein n=1 Tax=Fluctibacter halophilus TaxID=226011 RepID=A0ABS8GAZ1_9ALTE|nr:aspartyl protease family protein [Aestuariibacter halophilus]MCC2617762.1 aspartyl protease family protein [Aestuariibacter halophilus]